MENVLKTGTTTIGLVCKDGIVLAADKRITVGGGTIVGSAQKLVAVNDRFAITIAGTASDAFMLSRYLKSQLKLKELRSNAQVSVREAANLLAQYVYSNVRTPSTIPGITHFLIAGTDKTGQHLYDIYPDGSIQKVDDYFCSGSGQVYAYGLIDGAYKKGLTIAEAKKLAKKAIRSAIKRDTASGNGYDIAAITEEGLGEIETVVFDDPIEQ